MVSDVVCVREVAVVAMTELDDYDYDCNYDKWTEPESVTVASVAVSVAVAVVSEMPDVCH
jgi:hypothetical protein